MFFSLCFLQNAMEAAARGDLRHWELHATPLIALIILLDQYPRVLWRGTADVFKYDHVTRDILMRAHASGVCLVLLLALPGHMWVIVQLLDVMKTQHLFLACVALSHQVP